MTKRWIFGVLLVCLGNPAVADTQPKRDTSRGELLYSTYCTACHSDQIHWRDKKIATDWIGLNAQVRHWQGIMGQVWSVSAAAGIIVACTTLFKGRKPTLGNLDYLSRCHNVSVTASVRLMQRLRTNNKSDNRFR
jgi:hypothetical protein